MAKWSLFRSGNNQMRPLAITGIEETSGSIVIAAVETTSAGISTSDVKVRPGGAQVCNASPSPDRRQPVPHASVLEIGHQCPNRLEPGTDSKRVWFRENGIRYVEGITSGAADCQTGIL